MTKHKLVSAGNCSTYRGFRLERNSSGGIDLIDMAAERPAIACRNEVDACRAADKLREVEADKPMVEFTVRTISGFQYPILVGWIKVGASTPIITNSPCEMKDSKTAIAEAIEDMIFGPASKMLQDLRCLLMGIQFDGDHAPINDLLDQLKGQLELKIRALP